MDSIGENHMYNHDCKYTFTKFLNRIVISILNYTKVLPIEYFAIQNFHCGNCYCRASQIEAVYKIISIRISLTKLCDMFA